jgi:hypothetical protein
LLNDEVSEQRGPKEIGVFLFRTLLREQQAKQPFLKPARPKRGFLLRGEK